MPQFVVRSLGLDPRYHPHEEQTPPDRSQATSNPLYLLMASTFQHSSSESPEDSLGRAYVQGAGDDAESWACGLTPEMFWSNKQRLLSASDVELPGLVSELVGGVARAGSGSGGLIDGDARTKYASVPKTVFSAPSFSLSIGDLDSHIPQLEPQTLTVLACTETQIPPRFTHVTRESPAQARTQPDAPRSRTLHLNCRDGKLGSKDLRNGLRKLPHFLEDTRRSEGMDEQGQQGGGQQRELRTPTRSRESSENSQVQVHVLSPKSSDLPIGITLAILCLYDFSALPTDTADASLNTTLRRREQRLIDKNLVRKALAEITNNLTQLGDAGAVNPSRATLNAVNAWLMGPG